MNKQYIFEYENVFFDTNSEYEFDQLNESLYITNLIFNLEICLGADFRNYDFYIFSNHSKDVHPASKMDVSVRKKVLLYFSDESGRDPGVFSEYFFAIFKSYIGTTKTVENVFPLGIGYVKQVPEFSVTDIRNRKINVFFQGNLNKNRIDFHRAFYTLGGIFPSQRILKSRFYRKILLKLRANFNSFFPSSIIAFNDSFKSGLTPEKYGEVLSISKIILCPKGFTQVECFRHYEAMRAGCVIVSEKLPEISFYKDSPIIQIEDWKSGIGVVWELLSDNERLQQVQVETIYWWKNICSEAGMAKYVAKCLQTLAI